MGKKYIIELEDKPFSKGNGDFLYRVKGFNSLVFDMTGIGMLTPYTEPDLKQVRKEAYDKGFDDGRNKCQSREYCMNESYQQGLADAWEAAKKIADMPYGEEEKAFGSGGWTFIVKHTAKEAIEKIRQYEQENQFCVGDEFENESGKRFVIIKMDGTEIDRYVDEEGKTYCMDVKYKVIRKTGRSFPEIASVLKKMRGEQDGKRREE